jgi:sialate O-acetylesterase
MIAPGVGEPPLAPWDGQSGVATLFNGMIAPLGRVGLTGVAWYQGESDVGKAGYDRRLRAMIAGWRRQFAAPRLPFLVVGLARWGKPTSRPQASQLASLLNEQRLAAERDPSTALVPALDLGEQVELHPPNKQEVGRRLALAAQAYAYQSADAERGPLPLAARHTADGIRVDFSGPLRTLSGAGVLAFELCGQDQQSCRFADARVVELTSVVLPNDGRAATRVRYAWADYPIVNLYSGTLPVPTFELPIR